MLRLPDMRAAITILVLMIAPIAMPAQRTLDGSGNELYSQCQEEAASFLGGVCQGYVNGVADILDWQHIIDRPKGATRGQTTDVVLKYLKDHPETRDHPEYELVATALREAWPHVSKTP